MSESHFPDPPSFASQARSTLLPHLLPECPNARIALFAVRRMGAYGLADAVAAHSFFTAFGLQFRRPLVLMRALMAEVAATAGRTIAIAPCCCPRMTLSEAQLLGVMTRAETRPFQADALLRDLLASVDTGRVLATAAAVAISFADAGRPIS